MSNGAGQYFFAGRTAQAANSIRRGLIEFDIAGNIPTGSIVVSATLQLTMSRTIAGSQPVALHRLTADWGEGTSIHAKHSPSSKLGMGYLISV